MSYNFSYHPEVKKSDLPKIDAKAKAKIKKVIEERLTDHPELYGRPLQRTLKGYWKLRIGDYRVIYRVTGDTIAILGILHRKSVYSQIIKRT
jgi:mRNA interferase RelE/StbE